MIVIALGIAVLFLSIATWIASKLFSHEAPFSAYLITAFATTMAGLIPGFGFILSPITYLICLTTVLKMDFWPPAVVVWIAVSCMNFGLNIFLAILFAKLGGR